MTIINKKQSINQLSSYIKGILCSIFFPFIGLIFVPCLALADTLVGTYEPSGKVVWSSVRAAGTSSQTNLICTEANAGISIGGTIAGGQTFWGTVDGYEGLVLGPGVVLFFTGNVSSHNIIMENALKRMGINNSSYFIQFNSTGSDSPNAPGGRRLNWLNILLYFFPQGILPDELYDNTDASINASLQAHLYISKQAKEGTYSITAPIALRLPCNHGGSYAASFSDVGDIVIASLPRLCNIAISPNSIISPPQIQSMTSSIHKTGMINVKGSCTQGDSSTSGNIQFSIVADNPISSSIGGANSALALINTNNKKVGSVYFQNQAWANNYLSVAGLKYNVPVQWSNIDFNINYSVSDLTPADTQAFGVGRGTAKFIVEWP